MNAGASFVYSLHREQLLIYCRFIEVSEIHIEDDTRKCTFRVTIRYGTEIEQTFKSTGKEARSAVISRPMYVECL